MREIHVMQACQRVSAVVVPALQPLWAPADLSGHLHKQGE
jgi:hypothetical protein